MDIKRQLWFLLSASLVKVPESLVMVPPGNMREFSSYSQHEPDRVAGGKPHETVGNTLFLLGSL
jgi:hypothetical protein